MNLPQWPSAIPADEEEVEADYAAGKHTVNISTSVREELMAMNISSLCLKRCGCWQHQKDGNTYALYFLFLFVHLADTCDSKLRSMPLRCLRCLLKHADIGE